jgi:hypothetical protein
MFFWGRCLWLRHELLSGVFPLWDPYVGGGQSAAADALHQMFLIPALAVRLIGNDVFAFNLWVAVPFPLAAIGAWLFFARRFTAPAAALGAIAFSCSGPIVSTNNFPNMSWSVAAIPWVLWAGDRVLSEAAPGRIAALAVIVALQALSGEPVTLLATLVLVLAFGAAGADVVSRPTLRRSLQQTTAIGAAVALGLALAAVQLVPLARAAALSERSTVVAKGFWSIHPVALLEVISLHLFGDYTASQSLLATPWLPVLNSGREPFLFSIYFGVPLITLSLFGLAAGPVRFTRFWIAAGAAGLVGALGSYTPVYPFVRDHVPLLGAFRFPAKYLVIASMSAAAGAAAGWDAVRRRVAGMASQRFDRARTVAVAFSVVAAVTAGLAAGACLYFPRATVFGFFSFAKWMRVGDAVEAAAFMLRSLPHAGASVLLMAAMAAALMWIGTKADAGAGAARGALYVLVVADLLVHSWGLSPTLNAAYLAEPAWLLQTKAHPDSRIYVGGKRDGTLDPADLDSSWAYRNPPGLVGSASRAALSGTADFYSSAWRSREMVSYDLPILWPKEFEAMTKLFFVNGRAGRDLFLSRTGVRYRILPRRQALDHAPLVQIPYLMDSYLFDWGRDVAPRVAIVADAKVVTDAKRQIDALFESDWDAARTVLIEHQSLAAGDPGPPLSPSAKILAETANRVSVEANVPVSGEYLVLLDSFSDDWRVTADGAPAELVRANGLFRAVRLTAGAHVVDFAYRPRAVLVGFAISAIALVILGALMARGLRRSCI